MTYVSWAALYEGESDAAYFDLLIPRLMEEIVLLKGTIHTTIPPAPVIRLRRGTVDAVAREACAVKEACHLVFIHADTGGRNLDADLAGRSRAYCEEMREVCDWPSRRCITISPRHETEGWILADPLAITAALGFSGSPTSIGLPTTARQAEALPDPKATLEAAVRQVRGRRRPFNVKQIFAAIAQRQSFAQLRLSKSFYEFEGCLTTALADIGCVQFPAFTRN